jgi:hypothetical protein
MTARIGNCQDPGRSAGFRLTVPNRRLRTYKFVSFAISSFLNLFWGPRFGGQTGRCHTSPLNPFHIKNDIRSIVLGELVIPWQSEGSDLVPRKLGELNCV